MVLAIYCAGGLGKEVLELARSVNRWEKIVFVDDVIQEKEYQGLSICRFEEIDNLGKGVEFIIASGEPQGRKKLYEKIKGAGYPLATIISPWAGVYSNSRIGEGCILWDCGVSADVTIRENVVIGTKAIIGHDAVVDMHNVISAECFVGGHTYLEGGVYMGPRAMAKDRIRIGEGAIISMGAVLLRHVRPRAIMLGNPAKRIGENEAGKVFGMFD